MQNLWRGWVFPPKRGTSESRKFKNFLDIIKPRLITLIWLIPNTLWFLKDCLKYTVIWAERGWKKTILSVTDKIWGVSKPPCSFKGKKLQKIIIGMMTLLVCVCFCCRWRLFLLRFYWKHESQGQPLPFKSTYVFGRREHWTKNTLLLAVLCKGHSVLEGVLNMLCHIPHAEANNRKLNVFELEALSMCPDMRREWCDPRGCPVEHRVWVALCPPEIEQPGLSLGSWPSWRLRGCFLWSWLAGTLCTEPVYS